MDVINTFVDCVEPLLTLFLTLTPQLQVLRQSQLQVLRQSQLQVLRQSQLK